MLVIAQSHASRGTSQPSATRTKRRPSSRSNVLYTPNPCVSSGCTSHESLAGIGITHKSVLSPACKTSAVKWQLAASRNKIGWWLARHGRSASARTSSSLTSLALVFHPLLPRQIYTLPTEALVAAAAPTSLSLARKICGKRNCTSALSAMAAKWLIAPCCFLRLRYLKGRSAPICSKGNRLLTTSPLDLCLTIATNVSSRFKSKGCKCITPTSLWKKLLHFQRASTCRK